MTWADGAITSGTDPVAIVTGGSCGIGRHVVRVLAGWSYAIVVVYRDDHSTAEAAIDEILAAGGSAVAVRADLSDELDVERLFAETIAAFGGVDVVAHTTMRGTAVLYRHAARHLRRGAAIVTVSTAAGLAPAVARELREGDITINGLPPGLEPPGADHDVAELIACLDRGRHRAGE